MIIMIALTEMLYASSADTPEAVSVNEAIELTKRFSDDQGRMFINGALSTFLKNREKVMLSAKETEFRIF
jgi:N utilization substance protein B